MQVFHIPLPVVEWCEYIDEIYQGLMIKYTKREDRILSINNKWYIDSIKLYQAVLLEDCYLFLIQACGNVKKVK